MNVESEPKRVNESTEFDAKDAIREHVTLTPQIETFLESRNVMDKCLDLIVFMRLKIEYYLNHSNCGANIKYFLNERLDLELEYNSEICIHLELLAENEEPLGLLMLVAILRLMASKECSLKQVLSHKSFARHKKTQQEFLQDIDFDESDIDDRLCAGLLYTAAKSLKDVKKVQKHLKEYTSILAP